MMAGASVPSGIMELFENLVSSMRNQVLFEAWHSKVLCQKAPRMAQHNALPWVPLSCLFMIFLFR